MMDRRRFVLSSLAGALAAPLGAEAQETPKIPRVGIVGATSPAVGRTSMDAFRLGLRELGYIEGQSIFVEERWAQGRLERFGDLIAELLGSNVDVLVVASSGGRARRRRRLRRRPSCLWL
jgi:hypothetical protein